MFVQPLQAATEAQKEAASQSGLACLAASQAADGSGADYPGYEPAPMRG